MFRDCSSFLPSKTSLHPNNFINIYVLDLDSSSLLYLRDVQMNRPSDTLKMILITPDETKYVLVYQTQIIQIVDIQKPSSRGFRQSETLVTLDYKEEIPIYDNFSPQICKFSTSKPELTCFLSQTDSSAKMSDPIDTLVVKYNLLKSEKDDTPQDYYLDFFPLRLSKKSDLTDVDFLEISYNDTTSDTNILRSILVLRVGQSVLDVFELDEDYLSVKNDMVKNKISLKAFTNFSATPNELPINPKVNIKTLILGFSIGFGVVMLVLFLCHFKFFKDNIVNKYKKYKLHENNRINDDHFE